MLLVFRTHEDFLVWLWVTAFDSISISKCIIFPTHWITKKTRYVWFEVFFAFFFPSPSSSNLRWESNQAVHVSAPESEATEVHILRTGSHHWTYSSDRELFYCVTAGGLIASVTVKAKREFWFQQPPLVGKIDADVFVSLSCSANRTEMASRTRKMQDISREISCLSHRGSFFSFGPKHF